MTSEAAEKKQFIGKETDEWYTRYENVVNELDHYPKELFIGKKILFPCDWDSVFESKSRIDYETIDRVHHIKHVDVDADTPKCNFVRYFWKTYAQYPDYQTKLYASGYNPKDPQNPNNLSCMDVDYSNYDWVVTNPPFSFVSEYLEVLSTEVEKRKNTERPFHFLIMIPWQALGGKCATLIIDKKIYPGFGKHLNMEFTDIDGNPILNEKGKARKVCVYWATDLDMNFPTVNNNYFVPQHQYSENIHSYFDERLFETDAKRDANGNPCAIDVLPIIVHKKTQELYYDYPGYQAIPITSIDYYNPRVFTICASTQMTYPCKEIGNFKILPSAFGLQYKFPGLKKITSFLVKIRPEILEATKDKTPDEVFDACEHLLGIEEVKIGEKAN